MYEDTLGEMGLRERKGWRQNDCLFLQAVFEPLRTTRNSLCELEDNCFTCLGKQSLSSLSSVTCLGEPHPEIGELGVAILPR